VPPALVGGDGEPIAEAYPGAQPCEPLSTGYAGDEQCLKAPAPEAGFQLRYGPSSYDDADEIAKYLLEPGGELVDCVFVKTPNPTEVFVNQYHARLRPGTHHMITYTQPEARADSTQPEDCRQGAEFTFLVGATTPTTDILPDRGGGAPEDVGLALPIPPVAQAAIQMHYVNTGEEPLLKEGWINVVYLAESEVTGLVNPITWIGGLGMSVPPRTTEVVTSGGPGCTAIEQP
jgi:hypothetical protein